MKAKAIKSRYSRDQLQLSTYLSCKLGDSFDVGVVEMENSRTVNKMEIFCQNSIKLQIKRTSQE